MSDSKADKPKASEGRKPEAKNGSDGKKQEQAAPPPLEGFILELFFPVTKAILPTNFLTEPEAVRAAIAHFTAFPNGYAQVKDAKTNAIVLNHQQLFQRFRGR